MERMTSSATLLCLLWSGVAALRVDIPEEVYEFARGDNITLPCTFKSAQTDPKLITITWSAEADQANPEETAILTHFHPLGATDIKAKYEGRASIDLDIKSGKANLKLSSITLADNKNFECRVLIPFDDEGQPYDTTRLVVLVDPSTPICKIQGKAEYGQNINLTCVSEEGSPPPTYKWESRDVRNMPRIPDRRTTDKGGILSLYSISKNTSGLYICTSTSRSHSVSCNVMLTVMPQVSIGYNVTIFVMRTAFVITPFLFIYYYYCRRKKQKEEYDIEVLEDKVRGEDTDWNGQSCFTGGRGSIGDDDSSLRSPSGQSHLYEERTECSYVNSRDYDNQHSNYDDCCSGYNDQRQDD